MVTIWLILSAVLVVMEIISLGLTTVWFAIGALVAALAAFFHASFGIQLIIFAVVSLVLLVLMGPLARKHLIKEPEKTNVEGLVGKVGIVKSTIDNLKAEGVVMLNGTEWTARSENDAVIEAESQVEVCSISGVKLIVKKVEK
ncbi:MAG: NfeD family protein [Clostridium sp.]|nr:NfeD family protein [Clostridium sp.]MCM1398401.1 NfeD family protein [Clostridium sp.]MCM1458934.1 NfeD family protein [Bacteroides sp.]